MYLMSKDTIIAEYDFNTMLFKTYNAGLMPFALRGNNVNILTLRDWLVNRVLSLSRSNAKVMLSAINIDQNDKLAICYACRGLSLTDCYWIKENTDKVTWDDVNLYTNSLNKAMSEIALTGEYISIQGRIRTPELTGGGAYAKCWRRLKDGIYLYKTGSLQGNNKEHLIEVLCSDLLDELGVNHVKYQLAQTGLYSVSKCKNMTSLQISICDMGYFSGYCTRNNINLSQWLSTQQGYYEMLIVDYLIANTDRHLGNWGVYFNADTGNVISLHPLFDHNNALVKSNDIYSKVVAGGTREACARQAKKRLKLDTSKLVKYLKQREVKKRFKSIFGHLEEYNALLDRISIYQSW